MKRSPILALPALALLGGCQLLIGLDGGKPGSSTTSGSTGGGGATSSSTSTTSSSSTGGHGGTTSSTTSQGGGGSSGSTTSTTTTTTSASGACDGGETCSAPGDCADPGNECIARTCDGTCCGTSFLTTPIAAQAKGDCHVVVCDGAGATQNTVDDTDKPDPQDACHDGTCTFGVKGQAAKGGACGFNGGKLCGDLAGPAAGQCVECNTATDCATGYLCLANRCSALVIAATSATTAFGAGYQPAGTWSSPTPLGGSSTDDLGLAFTTSGTAVGALRIPHTGAASDDQVWYTTWAGTWTTAQAIAASAVFSRGGPSVSSGGATAQMLFQGTNYWHYSMAYSGTWSSAETLGPGGQSYGSKPGALAARGADATAVYFDGSLSNQISAQDHVAGSWQGKVVMSPTRASSNYLPTVVSLRGGTADLLAVYADDTNQIVFQTRAAGAWSAPAAIGTASTTTQGRPALAALPAGGAIMAFRGTDGSLYFATYNGATWSSVSAYLSGVPVVWMPALAPGLSGATAEIAFVKTSDNFVYHARLVGGAWTSEVKVGTQTASRVAIASYP